MRSELKKLLHRGVFLAVMAAVCAGGIALANIRYAENAPDVLPASAGQTPVIVLDAGHGEST